MFQSSKLGDSQFNLQPIDTMFTYRDQTITFTDKQKQLVSSSNIYIDFINKAWISEDVLKILSCIDEWNVNSFGIMRRISSLNRVIDQISFPRLQQLAISTGMVCIEGIHRMNLPKLQKLWLGNNSIISCRDFKKAHWPNLQLIYLGKNLMKEMDCLSQLDFQKVKRVSLSSSCEDAKWLGKISGESMESVSTFCKIQRYKVLLSVQKIKPYKKISGKSFKILRFFCLDDRIVIICKSVFLDNLYLKGALNINMLEADKCHIPTKFPNFYTHPKNQALRSAPAKVQQAFKEKFSLKIVSQEFPQGQKTQLYCGVNPGQNRLFHYCDDCGVSGEPAIFCNNCFDEQKHQDHEFGEYEEDDYPCSCGTRWLCSPQGFCGKHGKDYPEVEVDKDKLIQFSNFFKPIFQVLIFLYEENEFHPLQEEVESELYQALAKLTNCCLSYTRMATFLLLQEIKSEDKSLSILQFLLRKQKRFQKLMNYLQYDAILRYQFLKIILKTRQQGNPVYYEYSDWFLTDPEVLKKLIDDGKYFFEKMDLYFQIATKIQSQEEREDFCYRLFESMVSIEDKNTFCNDFFNISFDYIPKMGKKSLQILLKKCFEVFSAEQISNSWTKSRILSFIVNGSMYLQSSNFEKMKQMVPFLKQRGIPQESIFLFFQSATKELFHHFRRENKEDKGIIMFYMMISLHMKDEMIHKFWQYIFQDKHQQMKRHLDKLYFLISKIRNAEITCQQIQKNLFKSEEIDNESIQRNLCQNFKQFLREKKQVTKREVWRKKRCGDLSFKNAGRILNQICEYNEDLEVWKYKEENEQTQIEKKLIFPLSEYCQENFSYLTKNQTIDGILKSKKILKNQEQKYFLEKLFSSPCFLSKMNEIWALPIKEKNHEIKYWKQQNIGFLFLTFLILADKLCGGNNIELKQLIEKIKINPSERAKYEQYADKKFVYRILGIEDEKDKEEHLFKLETSQEKTNENILIKGAEKKKRMLEKFRNKAKIVLNQLSTKTQSMNLLEDEDVCVICHQRDKPNKKLAYMALVSKGQTLSCQIYQNQNKFGLLFSTCFHTIHTECFLQTQKSYQKYNCPLCRKSMNCLIPLRYSKQEEEYFDFCLSSIIIGLGIHSNVYNTESYLMMLFRHLVQSLGLNNLSLIEFYHSEKILWRKTNVHMRKLTRQILSQCSEQFRLKESKKIENLIASLKNCENQILRDIQKIIAEYVWKQLFFEKEEIDTVELNKIAQRLDKKQFSILKNEFSEYTKEVINIESTSTDSTNKQSISFKLLDLPQEADQFINLMKQSCKNCNIRVNDNKCLLCGEACCHSCFAIHLQKHPKIQCFLYLPYLRLQLVRLQQNVNRNFSEYIYLSQFQMTFSRDQQNEKFSLNKRKFDGIMRIFLEI